MAAFAAHRQGNRMWSLPNKRPASIGPLSNLIIAFLALAFVPAWSLDSQDKVYWANYLKGNIQRANMIDGSEMETVVEPASFAPWGLVTDVSRCKMYIADQATKTILVGNLDGSGLEVFVDIGEAHGDDQPVSLWLDSSENMLYWTQRSSRVFRASVLGETSEIEELDTWSSGDYSMDRFGIAVDTSVSPRKVYYADNQEWVIWRQTWGQDDEIDFVWEQSTIFEPLELDIDPVGRHLYWAESGLKEIRRVGLDGDGYSDVESVVLETDSPMGLTVSADRGVIHYSTDSSIVQTDLKGSEIWRINLPDIYKPRSLAVVNGTTAYTMQCFTTTTTTTTTQTATSSTTATQTTSSETETTTSTATTATATTTTATTQTRTSSATTATSTQTSTTETTTTTTTETTAATTAITAADWEEEEREATNSSGTTSTASTTRPDQPRAGEPGDLDDSDEAKEDDDEDSDEEDEDSDDDDDDDEDGDDSDADTNGTELGQPGGNDKRSPLENRTEEDGDHDADDSDLNRTGSDANSIAHHEADDDNNDDAGAEISHAPVPDSADDGDGDDADDVDEADGTLATLSADVKDSKVDKDKEADDSDAERRAAYMKHGNFDGKGAGISDATTVARDSKEADDSDSKDDADDSDSKEADDSDSKAADSKEADDSDSESKDDADDSDSKATDSKKPDHSDSKEADDSDSDSKAGQETRALGADDSDDSGTKNVREADADAGLKTGDEDARSSAPPNVGKKRLRASRQC